MSENLRVLGDSKKPLTAWLTRPVVDLSESEGAEEAPLVASRSEMPHSEKIFRMSKVQLESERVRRRPQTLDARATA